MYCMGAHFWLLTWPPQFCVFINKHQQEILNPAELCQGGYQGTDSSSFSQNSKGPGVKSQGSAPPLPHVAWIKSKIIFWVALLQTSQEHPSESSATLSVNHLAWRLGWLLGADLPLPALLPSYGWCKSLVENPSEIHWVRAKLDFFLLDRVFQGHHGLCLEARLKNPETPRSAPWKAISAYDFGCIVDRSQIHSSSLSTNTLIMEVTTLHFI